MAQQFKVIVNTGKDQAAQTLQAEQGAGQRGRPLIIKAKAGAKYQLVEAGKSNDRAPDNIKAKRVGKHLHLMFETDTVADVIIEDYYDVMPEGYNGVIGKAENGNFYEYLTEDPTDPGLIPQLKDNATAVTQALGGDEVAPAGAAVAFAAFPLLGALGLLGGAAAVAAAANAATTTTTTTGTTTGKLDPTAPNDSGVLGDNKTNDNTPTLTGTVPTGSTATVTVNGVTYPVTVNPNGTWSFTNPTNLPDGTYYPVLNVTTNGVTTPTNLTPFTIDTTPPTVAVTSNAAALAAGETANITFTLSEPSSDFALDDIAVSGGTLSNLTQSATDPKVYTATFTPSSTGTSATITVASDKFADAAANRNTDGAEANNTVNFKTNATVTGALTPTAPNDSGNLGDNLTNDNTPNLSGKVPAGSTATVTLNGKTYPATVDSTGKWTAQIPDTDKLPDGTYTPQLNVTTGGVTTTTPITPFTIDTVPATVVVTSNATTLATGQTSNVTFTLSEPVTDFTADDVVVTGGTLSNFQKSPTDPKVYTATFTPNTTGTSASITVPSSKFSDAAANFNTDGADTSPLTTNTVSLTTNALASGQLAAVSDNTTGVPNDHKTNDATPDLVGKVPAGSTATVTINGQTYPVTVAPDGTWTFTQPTNLPDGTYTPVLNVTTNGQTSSVPITPFTIDTVPPTVLVTGANTAALTAGQSTTLTFTLSEPTTDLTDADLAVAGGTLGPLQQSATNPLVYTATFTATPGTTANTTASVSIASDKFADAAGNLNKDGADTSPTTTNIWSSTVTPASSSNSLKTALAIDPIATDNVLLASESGATTYPITGKVTGTFAAGDVVYLKLGTNTYPAIVKADGTYSTLVSMTDLKADPDTKIEGTIAPTGGDPATAAQDYTVESGNVPTQTALSIDPVTADNIIGSTESTGNIAITGKVTGKFAAGDIVKLTVAGVTYSGTAAADGSYSIPVPAAGLIADSDTTVDGTVTGTGGTVANAIQDYGVVSTINPVPAPSAKTALTIDPITGDNVITLAESGATTYTVTGKVTGTFAVNDLVTLTLNTHPYLAIVKADGTYSVVVPMSDLKADADTKIEGTVTGTGGDTATAAQDYTVETTNAITQTALSIDPITADNIIGSTESNGNIALTGHVTGKFAAGDIVKLTVNGVTYSGTAAADGSYSIPVPAAGLIADSDTTVDGTVTGTAGTVANAIQNYGVDANINPVPAPSAKTALTIDPITGDNVITLAESGATTYTVTGKVTGTFAVNDLVTLTLNNHPYLATVKADGTYSVVVPMSDLKADADTKIEGTVTGTGGDTATAAQDYTVETTNAITQTALSIDPVTADNIIGSTESNGNIALTGHVTGKFAAGDVVKLTVNGVSYSGTAAADGSYSIPVPAAGLIADSDTTVDGTVTGTAGTVANAIQNYGVDANINPVPLDTTPPTIIVARTATGTLTSSETITFTLSEASKDFALSDVTYDTSKGSFSNFTAVPTSGTAGTGYTQYTATYTPTAGQNATLTIGVLSNKFADAAGNRNKDTFDPTDSFSGSVVETNNKIDIPVNTVPNPTPDTIPPTVVVARAGTANLALGNTDTITFTLSENSLTFDQNDVTVTGGTLTNWTIVPTSGSPSTGYHLYTATFVPTAGTSGTATIGVKAQTFKDAAGNNNLDTFDASQLSTVTGATVETNNVVSIGFDTTAKDTTPPKVEVVRTATGTITGPETIYFNFTEATTDFVLSDISVQGGAMSNLVAVPGSNNTQYTATFTPTAASTGNASIGVLAGKFSDAAANQNVDTFDNTSANYESNNLVAAPYNTSANPADTTPPTVAITRATTGIIGGTSAPTETVTFTFSEPINPSSFTLSDIDTSTGTVTNLVAVAGTNNTQFTATYTPITGQVGTATIGIASGKFTDTTGNNNLDTYQTGVAGTVQEGNNQVSIGFNTAQLDTTPPTIAVTRSNPGVTLTGAASTETITFTLSEASTTFGEGDIDTVGGKLSNFTAVPGTGTALGGYTQYTATFTPTNGQGTGTVGVKAGTFADTAGNLNLDTYVTGSNYEANNQVSLGYNTSATDTTPPSIIVSRLGTGTITAGKTETLLFTISELANFDATSITIISGGGAISNVVPVASSGNTTTGFTQYTATYTPPTTGAGQVQIGVLNGKVTDMVGLNNVDTYTSSAVAPLVYETNNMVAFNYDATAPDTTPPTIAVTRSGTGTVTKNETIVFTFSEGVPTSSFTLSDIDATGGSMSGLTPVESSKTATGVYTQYTALYTPTTSGVGIGTIGVTAGKFTDVSGNQNLDTYVAGANFEANNQVQFVIDTSVVDTVPPVIAVTRATSNVLAAGTTEVITFVLSEPSTSFDVNDITYSGGMLGSFAPVLSSGNSTSGYTQYTAVFTPAPNAIGDAYIGVKAGTFSDAKGNLNQDTFDTTQTGATIEANNQVKIVYSTIPVSGPTANADTNSVTEAGGTLNGTTFGDASGNVLSNDTSANAIKTVYDVTIGTATKILAAGVANSITGTYGTLNIKTDGTYTYTPNNAAPAVEALNVGSAPLVDTFSYTLKDGTGGTSQTTLKINITGTDDAPVVSVKEVDQSATIGTAFSYTVPNTTFSDVDNAVSTLTYSATLQGGAPLPSWLKFDPATRTFSGTPPTGTPATKLSLAVTATDPAGLSATDTFSLNVSSNHAPTANAITPPTPITELTNASAQDIAAINGTVSVNDVDPGNTLTASTVTATATWSGGTSLPTGVDVSSLIASSALTFGPGVTPNGTATNLTWKYDPAAANLDWLPAGQTLTITYPVTVADGQGGSAVQPLVITITGTNDAPVATPISQSYNKNAAQATVGLLTGATDPDNGETAILKVDATVPVTYTVTTNSPNGTAQAASTTVPTGVKFDAATGTITIDPSNPIFSTIAAGQNETIVATYSITDGKGGTTTTTATLVVNGAGTNAPIASNDTATAVEAGGTTNGTGGTDPKGNLLTNDTVVVGTKLVQDATGTSLTPVAATGTTNIVGTYGTLVLAADGSYTYNVANTNTAVEKLRTSTDTLTDTFSYTLKDGAGATSTAKLVVTLQGANDAPEAVNDTISAIEAGGVGNATPGTSPTGNVLTNDTDVDTGDTKVVSQVQAATGGAVPITAGTTSTTVATPVTGTYGALKLGADGSYSYTVDNTNATVQALKDANATVTDTFTYTVKDTAGATSTTTLTITIHGANDAPTIGTITPPAAIDELANASAQDIAAINGTFSVNDVDTGNVITATAGTATASWSGAASLPSGVSVSSLIAASALTFGPGVTPNGSATNLSWTYDPAAANLDWLPLGQTLTITYPVTVSDGQGGSATQNLVLTINGTNDAPVATPISKSYNKGEAAATVGLLTGTTDPDFGETASLLVDTNTAVTYTVTTNSGNGSAQAASTAVPTGVTLNANGTLSIDPTNAIFSNIFAGQNETIVATYKIADGKGGFTTTTATLIVNGAGSGTPIASNDTATAVEAGGTTNGTGGTDPKGNLLTNDTSFTGTKLVQDATGTTGLTTVGATGTTNITGAYGTLVLAADGSYTYNVANSTAAVEKLRLSTDTLTDTFTYTLKDGAGKTSTATLTVTLQGANDAPVAVADTTTATEAGGTANGTPGATPTPTGNVLTNDTDVDTGDTKVVSQVQGTSVTAGTTSATVSAPVAGTYGSLKLGADGSYTYTVDNTNATVQALKNSTDTLTDTFTYTVKDAAGLTSTSTLTVTVQGANDAPVVTASTTPIVGATSMVPVNFGTAFTFADVDVSTGVMTLTLSSSDTDGKITVVPGASGATITSGNGTNSVVVSGTLAQLQALASTASNFTFVNTNSYAASHDVTITALLNDNGNLGALASPLTGSGSIKFTVGPDANVNALIDITAITTDSGYLATDYITNDNTLVYSGTVSNFTANGDRIKLELIQTKNPDGSALGTPLVIDTTTVDPTLSGTNGTWTWNKQSTSTPDGTYQLRATIVDASGNRVNPATPVGSNTGTQDVQAIVIDSNNPNVDPNQNATIDIVSIVDAATGSQDTGTSSTDFITSDRTLTYKGTITAPTGWDTTQGDMVKLVLKDAGGQVVATQYVVPTKTGTGADWVWNDTGVTRDANTTYTLEATIVDAAGNPVNHLANSLLTPTPAVNGTNGGIDTQLITIDNTPPTQKAYVDSMTKDSGVTTTASINNNWITNDTSAGRLVSGFLDAPLNAGEVVNVYANGTLIGTATVMPGGTTWNITDLNGYNASWTYSAQVADAAGLTGPTTPVVTVTLDVTEAAPVITAVTDSAAASIATGGTTANALSTVKGTAGGGAAAAGATIYLYDNTYTNLVGTAIVDSSGNWTVTSLTGTFAGTNTFAAKQVDAQGNHSIMSTLFSVGTNLFGGGGFTTAGALPAGFTTSLTYAGAGVSPIQLYDTNMYNVLPVGSPLLSQSMGGTGNGPATTVTTGAATAPVSYGSGLGTWTKKSIGGSTIGAVGNPDGTITGNEFVGQVSTPPPGGVASDLFKILSTTMSVVAGQTYQLKFDYITGMTTENMSVTIDGVKILFAGTPYFESGHFTATYTAPTTKTIEVMWGGKNPTGNGNGDFVLDNLSFIPTSGAATPAFINGPTENPDGTLSYTAGALDALGSNDTITVTGTDLQAKLAAGGAINGGTGIDNLKLAAGTTLNLESLTGNQTVKPIEQVEIFTMQGGNSVLTMSANNVLSLGGSNASTMAPFTFASTLQTATTGGTQPTGSTSSTGKVQFVVNGLLGDTLNLDVLANDGVTSYYGASTGLLGNTGLAGTWGYKGTVNIAAATSPDGLPHTYKVYDHSLSGAQVLVDVDVTVNTITPITITAISTDAGVSATDFITNDQTLSYSGGLPAAFNAATERVYVEILNSANQVVSTGYATPSGTTWSWVDTTVEAAGNYTIRSTIVGLTNNTAVASYGAGAVATHPMTIELTPPTVAISRTDGLSTTVGATGTEVTFTVSEATTDLTNSDIEVNGGSLSPLVQSTTNPLVYTATFTPNTGAAGTGYVRIASNKFSDVAGNFNVDTYVTTDANYQANNLQNIPYDTLPPTQIVSFSSMTKDSGVTTSSTINNNWLTNDTSAGRLVSGFLSAPLAAGEVVNVYSNGTLIGTATVAAGGTTWEITDLSGYGTNASWTYTANVVDAFSNAGQQTSQVVNTDLTEAAPVITSVIDSANISVGATGTNASNLNSTANTLSTVKGTGQAGDTVFLYDNTYTNLVGTAVVDTSNNWSVTLSGGTYSGSNTFAAKQLDAQGNQSVTSNLWTVNAPAAGVQLLTNGNFSQDWGVGFTTNVPLIDQSIPDVYERFSWIRSRDAYSVIDLVNQRGGDKGGDVPGSTGWNLTTDPASAALTQRATQSWTNGTWSQKVYLAPDKNLIETTGWGTFYNMASGKILAGSLVGSAGDGLNHNLWVSNASVVAGKTYTFKFNYWDTISKDTNTNGQPGDAATFMDVSVNGQYVMSTNSFATGEVTINYVATTTGSIPLVISSYRTNGLQGSGDYALDNMSFTEAAPTNTLAPGVSGGATANPDSLTYIGAAIDALDGNDTITTSNANMQSTFTGGRMINGGAGIDNLKLIAGTKLNLEAVTGNQTVKPIEQIEMFTMQGGSSVLTMSANDVLSLGGSNATTMAPYSFTSTQQTGTAPTGSTASTGKVQFVVNGQTGDTLNLDVLANDGVTSTNGDSAGLLGNTGLAGTWAYKGTISIAAGVAVDGIAHTYKVYDHSTTGAQVLVDVNVTVNTITPITITAISTDAGVSATDFITNDQTLSYAGSLPAAFTAASERVYVEIINNANQVVSTGFATPSGTTWSWVDATTRPAGDYTIRSTIVGLSNTTAVAAYGAGAVATQPMTIDLTTPTVAISRTDGLSTTVGSTGTEVTFTVSEATTDLTNSDIEVNGGSLSPLVQSTTNPLVYTATFTPTTGAAGTGYVRIASNKFSDVAGNFNLDTYDSAAASPQVYQANNLQNIPYDTLPPTQTVSFSSMTKDSGVTTDLTINNNWLTNDTSAGRLVSGFLSAPLAAGEVVNVYSNGTLIGTATVAAGGTTWEITDLSGYATDASWTYTANVVDAFSNAGQQTSQVVNTDLTEAAPVISGVFDTASSTTTIANNGSTTNALSTVKGTGQAGDTIFLYDNNYTTLVGTAVVDVNGNWSVTSLTGTFGGSNTFAAKQVGEQGNQSKLSNTWTVIANENLIVNGQFTSDASGWTLGTSTGGSLPVAINTISGVPLSYLAFSWNETGPGGWAKQTMTTKNGGTYTVSLSVSANVDSSNPQTALIEVLDGTTVLATKTQTTNTLAATIVTFDFVATSPSTTLRITNSALVNTLSNDLWIDNVSVTNKSFAGTVDLVTSADLKGTSGADTLSYTAGALDALGSNDTITVTGTDLQAKLAAGGVINGGAGIDNLKLIAGTALNLETLTGNQTVKPIEQIEMITMQGGTSKLTMSANDVLSLGGSNATTMSAYSFASSTGGASSTGKVQFVVNATGTDTVTLGKLTTDGITTNGVVGNTGLDGIWTDMGTTTIGSVTYKVYNHSTTDAQVLVSNATVSLPATLAPVAIDLNHDGVLGYSQIQMDLNADGVLDHTAWVGAKDGVLVRDSFGDGSVRSTKQFVFARNSGETDLQGLAAQFDSNHDGVLDAKDAQFGEFAVWQDADQDGVSDAGEVKHLTDLGITSIKLASDAVLRTPATGVTEAGHTTATAADGSTLLVTDAAFDYTLGTANATGPVAVQADAAKSAVVMQNKPYTLSPEQIAQFQAVVDAAAAAAGDNAVDVSINELAPTGLEPLVFQHVLPINCEPSVLVPPAPIDAALPTDATAVVDQQQPTHCDEPWLIQLNGPTGTEPVVLNLNPAAWNKPFTLSAEPLAQLNLPVPTDSLASQLKLNVTDVLLTPADATAQPALQINGTPVTGDTLNLSTLLSPAGAPAHLTGTAQIEGQAFNFAADATLQAMIDQQLQHATVS